MDKIKFIFLGKLNSNKLGKTIMSLDVKTLRDTM